MVEAIRRGDIPGVQLRTRQPLPVGTDEAWRWLTETELMERWLADAVRREPGSAEAPVVELEDAAGAVRERGETLRLLAPRRWVLSFRKLDCGWEAATRLTLGLSPGDEECEAMVFHEGFERLSLSLCLTAWEEYRRRWRDALARLEAALGGVPAG